MLSACGGGGGGAQAEGEGPVSGGAKTGAVAAAPITDTEAARFLLQAQFSASDSEITAVKSQGYEAWLTAQFALPISETGTAWLDNRGRNVPTTSDFVFSLDHGDFMGWKMLMTGADQVRKRTALALSEVMVVSLTGINTDWPAYVMAGYWDTLNKYAFGNFRNLLEAITLNPAMGLYLSTKGNEKEDGKGRLPDENYAREVMQLFTIGLYQLNADGTEKLGTDGKPIETYKQEDITNLARVFTGYEMDYAKGTMLTVPWSNYKINSTDFSRHPMKLNPSKHSTLSASFLGTTIPANTDGATALKIALDTLFNHPNTGPFIARQLIQRLVTSNPSAAYVGRVAAAFNNNGTGVRGDMQAVWRAVLTDSEARSLSTAPTAGKLREPIVRLTQWARTFNAASSSGKWEIGDLSNGDTGLGQSPLRAPSVFNFFRPGYTPPHTAIASNRNVAPEFQLHNETTTAGYINLMAGVLANGWNDVKPDYTDQLAMAHDATKLLDWLNLHLTANQLSANTLNVIKTALETVPLAEGGAQNVKVDRVQAAMLLVMACPEYLIQK